MNIRFLIVVFFTAGLCTPWIETTFLTAAEQEAASQGAPPPASTEPLSSTEP